MDWTVFYKRQRTELPVQLFDLLGLSVEAHLPVLTILVLDCINTSVFFMQNPLIYQA